MENRGRAKGSKKVGGIKKGGVQLHTAQVKEAVLRVFEAVNENDDYLLELAHDDKKLFLSLLARLVPTEQSIQIDQTVRLDLGGAMREANERLSNFNADMVDVTNTPTARVPLTQHDAQRIYGKRGEAPLPDPSEHPSFYEGIPQQANNKELWAGYEEDSPKPGQRTRSKRRA